MIEFKTSEQRYKIENHVFWMYRVTYEIEMHINAVLSLNSLVSRSDLFSDLTTDMIFYHNQLALIHTAFILKNKTDQDEKHSLFCLKNFLDGKQMKTSDKAVKAIFDKISDFYEKYQDEIDKLIKKRDAEAHELKVDRQVKCSAVNQVSFNKQLAIVKEVREITKELHVVIFERDLPSGLEYPINLYGSIYDHSLKIIESAVKQA